MMPLDFLVQIPLLFFAIIVHEFSHGAVADYFGDDTARVMGRLTFNPLPHVDPVGTVLLPLLCYLAHAPMFGWAKPVPVDTRRLRARPWSELAVAGAGPFSNFFLAALAALFLWIALRSAGSLPMAPLLAQVLDFMVIVNLYLAVFNLLPIHPLDGSRVLANLLPYRLATAYEGFAPYGFVVILALMWTGFFGRIIAPVVYWLYNLLV